MDCPRLTLTVAPDTYPESWCRENNMPYICLEN